MEYTSLHMKWASAASDRAELAAAIEEAAAAVRRQLGECPADLIIAFVSSHHAGAYGEVPARLRDALGDGLLLGCSAGGVIGGGHEIEQRPGVALLAAYLPGVMIRALRLRNEEIPAPDAELAHWQRLIGAEAAAPVHCVLLPDPFTFDIETLLRGLDIACPDSTIIGGIASGGRQAGANALFLAGERFPHGLVGVALSGNITIDTIVAQGCRPIGEPMFVTACEGNVIRALDGRPPLAVLQQLHDQLDARDRQLARHSLFLGIVMKEDRVEYRQGDFLIRNLVGIDARSGALAIGGLVDHNAIVQFHLRDAETSAQDLEAMLRRYRQAELPAPQGALLFSCLGRGQFLYGRPDHDTELFRRSIGEVPLGGFFCNGEIGPVHGATFVHGYTSAFGLFRDRDS